MVSIKNTIEYSSWEDKLTFEEYKEACYQVGLTPLWSGSYSQICAAFNKQQAFDNLFGEEINEEK